MRNRILKFPDDIRKLLDRRWVNCRSDWLAGDGEWPLQLTLGHPIQSDVQQQMDAVRDWVQAWQRVSVTDNVEWQERQWSSLGRQLVPVRLALGSPDDIARWVGEEMPWRLARSRFQILVERWPLIARRLARQYEVLSVYDEQDFERLIRMLAWLHDHPNSNLFPRQLPVAGLDTKWLESRKPMIAELLAALRGIDGPSSDFWQCCGLRPLPNLVRIGLLDPILRDRVGGVRDLSAPIEELSRLDLPAKYVFIVENLQTGLAFEDLDSTIVVMGLGYGVDALRHFSSIQRASAFYWGDIDTHGFAILSRARQYLPGLQSIMMDEATLLRYRELVVDEKSQHGSEALPNLNDSELAVYRNLKQQTWGFQVRLEQERIPWPDAWPSVKTAHAGRQ